MGRRPMLILFLHGPAARATDECLRPFSAEQEVLGLAVGELEFGDGGIASAQYEIQFAAMDRQKVRRLLGDLAAPRGEELVQAGEDYLPVGVRGAPSADFV